MTKHRFFCRELDVGENCLDSEESRHATGVLRLKAGTAVELFNGTGKVGVGEIVHVARSAVTVNVDQLKESASRSRLRLTIVTAMPRANRQQFLFEKCTELGVSAVVPAIYERSTVLPQAKSREKWERWTIEAAKQAGCSFLPTIGNPLSFRGTIDSLGEVAIKTFGAVTGDRHGLAQAIGDEDAAGEVAMWIGPEGGFTVEEVEALLEAGAKPVELGEHTLRIETAVLAAAAIVGSLGDQRR